MDQGKYSATGPGQSKTGMRSNGYRHFYRAASLKGLRILLAEDEYLIARALASYLSDAGAIVVGPVASVTNALRLFENSPLSGAIVDIKLGRELAYPLADRLDAAGVSIVFYSGNCSLIPDRYAPIRCIDKHRGPEEVTSGMLAQVARDFAGLGYKDLAEPPPIETILPRLRGMARALVSDPDAADDIVEEALRRVVNATVSGTKAPNFARRLADQIEEIWHFQKLSRLS
ncbi:MAG: hypothetical protein ABI832_11435 [bacterium]